IRTPTPAAGAPRPRSRCAGGRPPRRYNAGGQDGHPTIMPYKDLTPPPGDKITRAEKLTVPDHPVIPFIRGDGTGPDIWAASVRVMDAAVEKAYGVKKKSH